MAPQTPERNEDVKKGVAMHTPTPRKRGAFSADNSPSAMRYRNLQPDDGSPEPDIRFPESFYEGREPLVTDAGFRASVSNIFIDFVSNYTAHYNSNVVSADAREIALLTLKDSLFNSMWRLLNWRGRSFTDVFGSFPEKRRA